MEGTKKVIPPSELPAKIPQIYLNTTERDKICLLTHTEGRNEIGGNGVSYSLPNLADPEKMQSKSQQEQPRPRKLSTGDTRLMKDRESSLSVYCSPRVSRKCVSNDWLTRRFSPSTEAGTLWHEHHRKRGRRGSQDSVESDSSLRSASHISTCATSEYTRFSSVDHLSMSPMENSGVDEDGFPIGRMRRIYSNPEAPVYNGTSSGVYKEEMKLQRDSKSCTHLESSENPRKTYREEGNKLTEETVMECSTSNPPVPIECDAMETSFSEKTIIAGQEQILENLYKAPFMISQEDLAGKDKRIRQWLKDVYQPQINGTENIAYIDDT